MKFTALIYFLFKRFINKKYIYQGKFLLLFEAGKAGSSLNWWDTLQSKFLAM